MDRKKELKLQFKESKPHAGVYQIKNTQNQKIFVGSTMNLKTLNGKRFELNAGTSPNKSLQNEWKKYGEEAFVFEVLEVLKEKKDGPFNKKEALKSLEKKWLDRLQPYGDHGYNRKPDIET
ncbi:GIY-YIG nuclease family protein [Lihuaxuella thermophila]|uniref:Group I intron endonuclease n=1 Tax=Lihuaxuella thermophila TaxID=1173111 RepID=A0A1H8APY1_9BACL|nr:GIY-YIG nuclease family protein [Lihuaxuella thermophila]SEM72034.1 group I intron endonuclease [Lihuaxuella thermophila]